jgi:hypothetical protein
MHFGQILTYLEPFKGRVPEKAKNVKMTSNSYHYKNTVKHAYPRVDSGQESGRNYRENEKIFHFSLERFI